MQQVLSTIYLHTNWEAYVLCTFNYLMKNEGFLKFTGSHVHC